MILFSLLLPCAFVFINTRLLQPPPHAPCPMPHAPCSVQPGDPLISFRAGFLCLPWLQPRSLSQPISDGRLGRLKVFVCLSVPLPATLQWTSLHLFFLFCHIFASTSKRPAPRSATTGSKGLHTLNLTYFVQRLDQLPLPPACLMARLPPARSCQPWAITHESVWQTHVSAWF